MATQIHSTSSFKLNDIPIHYQAGITVLRWSEDPRKYSSPPTCHLSIDPKGFYLICHNISTNEVECFDLALIHDTRTGSSVTLPQGIDEFNDTKFGMLDAPRSSKFVSIYYGNTFVASNDLRIIHFIFQSPNSAQKWSEQIFLFGHNQVLRNLSSLECLEKIHSKILYGLTNPDKKIPVQNLIQFLCKSNRDYSKEAKIRQALEDLKLINKNKTDLVIDQDQFTFKKFFRLYMNLMCRHEIENLFRSTGGKHRKYITWENLKGFIRKQNDSSADDGYEQKAKDLIEKYTQYDESSKTKEMNEESFLRYLLSFDNLIIDPTILNLSMDMNKPLSHYFIASSHNTYLTGSQFTGRASIEMYRQVLLTGCRCIELDVMDSGDKKEEPEIKHIHTPVRPVRFIDVIVAIREYAFKVTPYPLVLSIENHCSPTVQDKMARCFVDVFGDNLLTEPLDTHPCKENHPLPSPNDLKYKILLKNKKLKPNLPQPRTISATSSSGQSAEPVAASPDSSDKHNRMIRQILSGKLSALSNSHRGAYQMDDFSDEEEEKNNLNVNETKAPESKPTKVLSDLVNYIAPVRFKTFIRSEERNLSYEMSSFNEDKAYNLVREHAKDFLAYNQRQLSRIYPRGTRFDSSNYNPYLFWPIGCQMVALNYQTLDTPMQVNLALFSLNGACGYLEKPSALCQFRSSFDPRISKHIENVVSYQIDIKILSGQFLCQDREPTYVDIQMYGMYGDMNKRHEYRIRAKHWNGFQAIYDETDVELGKFSHRFDKIILPEIASLRFSVTTDDGNFIGQSLLPITHLRSGYRHIVLRNQMNIPINSSSLFIFIRKSIYINEKDLDFANRLVEPLIHQNSKAINNTSNVLSSDMYIRFHKSHSNEFEQNTQLDTTTTTTSYLKHIIAGSELSNIKRLSKILSINDIDPREIQKREQNIHHRLRRISFDYQPKIEQAKARLQESRNSSYNISNKQNFEENLLKIYSEKLHQQVESERKQLDEYYRKIEKEIKDDYNERIILIDEILKKDRSQVSEDVRLQIERDTKDIGKKKTSKEKMNLLKKSIYQKHTNAGAITSRMLEDMYAQLKDLLEKNLPINLNQVEEQKALEIENCFQKYAIQYNELETELACQLSRNESYNNPSTIASRMKSPSISAASPYPSQVMTLNQQTRRQTIN